MEDTGSARVTREGTTRRRAQAEWMETGAIVALACLVLLKGAPVVIGIALGIGTMFMALARL